MPQDSQTSKNAEANPAVVVKTAVDDLKNKPEWEKMTAEQRVEFIRNSDLKLPDGTTLVRDVYDRGVFLNNIIYMWVKTSLTIKKEVEGRFPPGNQTRKLLAAFIAAQNDGLVAFSKLIFRDLSDLRDYGRFFTTTIPLVLKDIDIEELERQVQAQTRAENIFSGVFNIIEMLCAKFPQLSAPLSPTMHYVSWAAALKAFAQAGQAFFKHFAAPNDTPKWDGLPVANGPTRGAISATAPLDLIGAIAGPLSPDVHAGLESMLGSIQGVDELPEIELPEGFAVVGEVD